MVNTLSHLGVGFLVALALGLTGKKFKVVAFLSVLPDLDLILYSVFTYASSSLSHETRNQLFYLFGHREFMHSILFIFLVVLSIWFTTRDWFFTFGGFQSILSHVYLDYVTTWKMHPFYPFSTDASVMGAIYFFDPLLNLLPLVPLLIVIVGNLRQRGKLKGKLNNFYTFVSGFEDKLYALLIIMLLFWLTFMPVSKAFLVNRISDVEKVEICYQDTYPASTIEFLTAYSFNSTDYKVLELNYLSGIEKSEYVKKISVDGDVPDASTYIEKTAILYQKGVPQEIDYPVYSVSKENDSVTVTLSDARNPYIEGWAYFKSFYRFIFDTKNGEYQVYASIQDAEEEQLGRNWFG
jgi:inner membrane protein